MFLILLESSVSASSSLQVQDRGAFLLRVLTAVTLNILCYSFRRSPLSGLQGDPLILRGMARDLPWPVFIRRLVLFLDGPGS